MTNYVYTCKCGKLIERDFPMGKHKQRVKCECGKFATKEFQMPIIQFKGEGWTTQVD